MNPERKSSEDTLNIVKRARKQAEEDARLLANRIALLKQEELKTIKKINETTRKAMEIYKVKEQNEKRLLQVLALFFDINYCIKAAQRTAAVEKPEA